MVFRKYASRRRATLQFERRPMARSGCESPGDRRVYAQSCARVCVRVRVRVQSQAADVEAQFRHLLQEVARARACSDEVRVRAGSAECSVP